MNWSWKRCFNKFILEKNNDLVELDKECVNYLIKKYPLIKNKIINKDFLKLDLKKFLKRNLRYYWKFSYNISSKLFLKLLSIEINPLFNGMFQKEVAERICIIQDQKNMEFYLF